MVTALVSVRLTERDPEDLSFRCILPGKEINPVIFSPLDVKRVVAELSEPDLVLETRDLPPLARGVAQVLRPDITSAARSRSENPTVIRAGLKPNA